MTHDPTTSFTFNCSPHNMFTTLTPSRSPTFTTTMFPSQWRSNIWAMDRFGKAETLSTDMNKIYSFLSRYVVPGAYTILTPLAPRGKIALRSRSSGQTGVSKSLRVISLGTYIVSLWWQAVGNIMHPNRRPVVSWTAPHISHKLNKRYSETEISRRLISFDYRTRYRRVLCKPRPFP